MTEVWWGKVQSYSGVNNDFCADQFPYMTRMGFEVLRGEDGYKDPEHIKDKGTGQIDQLTTQQITELCETSARRVHDRLQRGRRPLEAHRHAARGARLARGEGEPAATPLSSGDQFSRHPARRPLHRARPPFPAPSPQLFGPADAGVALRLLRAERPRARTRSALRALHVPEGPARVPPRF